MANDIAARGGYRGSASLVDILDRVLDKGLVVAGDIKVSIADIELLTIRIRLMICSIDKAEQIGLDWWKYDPNLAVGRHEAMLQENASLREQLRVLEQRVQALSAPPKVAASRRKALLAHERVNGAVLREHTVIPMSFGMVFRAREDVVELLRSAHDAFLGVLAEMDGKIEFGLKVSWNRDAQLRALEQEDEELRSLREEIAGGAGAGFAARMQYGQLVEAALEQRSERCVAVLLRRLRDVSVASRCNDTMGERMIMNAAFLVQRRRETAFEQRLQAIAQDWPGLDFQLTGPWPPYNFVAIRLKQEQAR